MKKLIILMLFVLLTQNAFSEVIQTQASGRWIITSTKGQEDYVNAYLLDTQTGIAFKLAECYAKENPTGGLKKLADISAGLAKNAPAIVNKTSAWSDMCWVKMPKIDLDE